MSAILVSEGPGGDGHRFLGPKAPQLSSFGQDHDGELCVISLAGGLYRLDPA